MSKEAITEDEVVALAKQYQVGNVSEKTAREMAVACLAKEKGLYDEMFLSKGATADATPVRVAKSAAELTFDKHVSAIKSRDKCAGTQAMAKARQEHPEAFEAMQSA
jgi:hypothetical protein